MKRVLACLFVGGLVAAGLATDSRILTLGRSDAFFMDDYSIFRNPANLNIYPNMLMGSLGYYGNATPLSKNDSLYAALKRENRDPLRPFAGGIVSYSLNQSSEAGSQYPMLSLGVVVNRYDEMFDLLPAPGKATAVGNGLSDTAVFLKPAGRFDVMAGYAFRDGGMLGAGGYFAFQKDPDNENIETSLYKGTVGVNWPLAKSTDIEASVGVGALTSIGTKLDSTEEEYTLASFSEDRSFGLDAEVRLFTALSALNGDFVPHFGLKMANLTDVSETEVSLGLGANINVDKGFGWGGLEFVHTQVNGNGSSEDMVRGVGGRLGFGFERNIIWDWFLLRAGVSKTLLYVTDGSGEKGYWSETLEADASDDDMIGVGFGVNVENRLKIDMVVAEDLFYTFTNLISGPQDHLLTRFTFTFSF